MKRSVRGSLSEWIISLRRFQCTFCLRNIFRRKVKIFQIVSMLPMGYRRCSPFFDTFHLYRDEKTTKIVYLSIEKITLFMISFETIWSFSVMEFAPFSKKSWISSTIMINQFIKKDRQTAMLLYDIDLAVTVLYSYSTSSSIIWQWIVSRIFMEAKNLGGLRLPWMWNGPPCSIFHHSTMNNDDPLDKVVT